MALCKRQADCNKVEFTSAMNVFDANNERKMNYTTPLHIQLKNQRINYFLTIRKKFHSMIGSLLLKNKHKINESDVSNFEILFENNQSISIYFSYTINALFSVRVLIFLVLQFYADIVL